MSTTRNYKLISRFEGAWDKIGFPNGKVSSTRFKPKHFDVGKRFRPNEDIPVTISMLNDIFSLRNLIRNPGDPISLPLVRHLRRTKIPEDAISFVAEGLCILFLSSILSNLFTNMLGFIIHQEMEKTGFTSYVEYILSKRGLSHDNMRRILYTRLNKLKNKLEILNLEGKWVMAEEDDAAGSDLIYQPGQKKRKSGLRIDTSKSLEEYW